MSRRVGKLTKEEEEGFDSFAREHYTQALRQAEEIAVKAYGDRPGVKEAMTAVFDKIASPRVFLIDKWRDLDPEDRRKYYPAEEQERQDAEEKRLRAKMNEEMSS